MDEAIVARQEQSNPGFPRAGADELSGGEVTDALIGHDKPPRYVRPSGDVPEAAPEADDRTPERAAARA